MMLQNELSFEKRLASMSAAVCEVIDNMPHGFQFHGNQLADSVVALYPAAGRMYTDTMLRMARRHRRGEVRLLNRNKSLYERV